MKRRKFIHHSLAMGSCVSVAPSTSFTKDFQKNTYEKLDKILGQSILNKELFKTPLIIDKVELLHYDANFICRVKTKDGLEGLSVSNNMQMAHLYPIFVNRIQPFFIGKDARNLENLLQELYVYKSNYKLQNLALWVPQATIEFALLDVLGKAIGKSISDLLGGLKHLEIAVYQANNHRGKSAEESIGLIEELVEKTGAKALKFKLGGRMSNNADYPAGRTEKLIPLIRKTFGDDMTIYADSNGSYTVKEAIRIGKLMENHKFDFYEEPVPFDWYEETKQVKEGLKIRIAGGEQEPSMHNFRWLIGNNALDIVQPDLFYFGGMIRSMKVAKMAEAMGKTCTPHISGSGLGYLYMMQFVAALSNAGPYHEFKGLNKQIQFTCATSDLKVNQGKIKVPTGAGLGIEIDEDYVKKHTEVKAL